MKRYKTSKKQIIRTNLTIFMIKKNKKVEEDSKFYLCKTKQKNYKRLSHKDEGKSIYSVR